MSVPPDIRVGVTTPGNGLVVSRLGASSAAAIPRTESEDLLRAALATAVAGDLVDLGGLKHTLSSPLAPPAGIHLVNFDLAAAGYPALDLSAGDITLGRGRVSRDSTGGATSPNQSAIIMGARSVAENVDVDGAMLACIYAGAGVNDWTVRGGVFLNTSRRQNACAVMHGAGSGSSEGAKIADIKTHASYTAPDGILLFNSSYARVRDNRIAGLRVLPTLTLTGWTLVSGNIYKTVDRTDGSTRVLKDNGTQRNETLNVDPTAPSANEFGVSGGFVYLNLGGTDPNTHTITSDVLSGYAYMLYATATSGGAPTLKGNLFKGNYATDCDGFGIYLQLGTEGVTSFSGGNKTEKNYLQSCALAGLQHSGLPHSALGVNGGTDSLLEGDTIENAGYNGVWMSNAGSGRAVDVLARGCTQAGFRAQTGDWSHDECKAVANTTHGFTCHTQAAESFADLQYDGCRAKQNGSVGLNADNTSGSALALSVIGGHYTSNGQDGVKLVKCRDSVVDGPISYLNGAANWQINIADAGSARIRIANWEIRGGNNGLRVDAGTDISVGRGLNAATVTRHQIGATVRVEQDPLAPQTISADADFTLTPLASAVATPTSPYLTKHTGTLTANRAVTLATTNVAIGIRFRIVRTGGGAFNLNVGSGPLKALATNTWAEFEWDGAAWILAAYGSL